MTWPSWGFPGVRNFSCVSSWISSLPGARSDHIKHLSHTHTAIIIHHMSNDDTSNVWNDLTDNTNGLCHALKTADYFIWLLTQYSHVIFALFFVFINQVVKVISEVLEQRVLLIDLQSQNPVQKLCDGAVCDTRKTLSVHGWFCVNIQHSILTWNSHELIGVTSGF